MQEFAGCHNMREQDTIDMMRSMAGGMDGKRLACKALTAPKDCPRERASECVGSGDTLLARMERKKPESPTVRLVRHSYQPSRAELEQDHSMDATFEQIAKAVTRTVKVEFNQPAKRRG